MGAVGQHKDWRWTYRCRNFCTLIMTLLYCCVWRVAASDFSSGGAGQFFFRGVNGGGAPVDNKSFYDVLGVLKTADASAIKRSYRKLAIKMHPDKGGDQEKFKLLGEAYTVLSDPEKRRIYDTYGKEGLEGGGRAGQWGGADVSDDILSALFGGFSRRRQRKVPDAAYEIDVSLEDLYNGTPQRVPIWVETVLPSGERRRTPKIIELNIEPGTRDKTRIVQKGALESGSPDILPGDRIFIVREVPQQQGGFSRFGDHLLLDIELTLLEALTGYQRPVYHLDSTTINLKGGGKDGLIRPGEYRRVRNKGMPKTHRPGEFGDLYLRFRVQFPSQEHISAWSEEEIATLSKLLPPPMNPRLPRTTFTTATSTPTEPTITEAPDPMIARALDQESAGARRSGDRDDMGQPWLRFFGL